MWWSILQPIGCQFSMVVGKQFFFERQNRRTVSHNNNNKYNNNNNNNNKSFHILTALGKYEDWKYVCLCVAKEDKLFMSEFRVR